MRVSDTGTTDITKNFRLRFTKRQQHHEILLKCHCLYQKKKSFCPEVLAISLQEKSPTVTPTMGWSGEQGKLEWDALLQDQLPADGQGFCPLKCIRKKVIIYNFFESISWTRKLHTCCLAFLNSQAKSDRHHLRFSSHFSSDSTMTKVQGVFVASFYIHMWNSMDASTKF